MSLDPPRCPNCGSIIDLAEPYRLAPKASNTLIGRVGILCPVCGAKLRALQTRSYLIGLLALFLPLALAVVTYIAAPVARGSTEYGIRMVIFFVVLVMGMMLYRRRIPRSLTIRLVENGEVIRYPLTPRTPRLKAPSPSTHCS